MPGMPECQNAGMPGMPECQNAKNAECTNVNSRGETNQSIARCIIRT